MKHLSLLSVPLAFLLSPAIFAGVMGPVTDDSYFISLSGGPAWSEKNNRSQILALQPDVVKAYLARKNSHTLGGGEIFFGKVQSLQAYQEALTLQAGLAVAGAGSMRFAGDILEDADPDFNNFTYHYNVNHLHVAAKAKLFLNHWQMAQPYISGSVGVGFNRAHDFSIHPRIEEEVPSPRFAGHTKTAFTYTAGGGLQRAISRHWQAGIGYEFSDWGKSKLSRAPEQTLSHTLSLNNLYVHQLQFTLSFAA